MRLRLFRAATTPDALARVRKELGPDALILSTRRVTDGVEITAALEPLQLVGAKTGQVNVYLHRSPQARLVVTIQFQLEPGRATANSMRPASK